MTDNVERALDSDAPLTAAERQSERARGGSRHPGIAEGTDSAGLIHREYQRGRSGAGARTARTRLPAYEKKQRRIEIRRCFRDDARC